MCIDILEDMATKVEEESSPKLFSNKIERLKNYISISDNKTEEYSPDNIRTNTSINEDNIEKLT